MVATVEHARRLLNALSTPGEDELWAADTFAAVGQNLLDLLMHHLADGEDLVVPAMLEHGEQPLL